MKFKFVFLLLTCAVVNYTHGARILGVFPMPGVSHYILDAKLMKGLVVAGHDVTMISPFKLKDVPKNGKYTDIVLEELSEEFQNFFVNSSFFKIADGNFLTMMGRMNSAFITLSNVTLHHPKVKQLLASNQKFDAVIMEQFNNDAMKVFAHLFDCPLIVLSSHVPSSAVSSMVGNPEPVSYVARLMMDDFSKNLSFVNRARNLLAYIIEHFIKTYYALLNHEAIMRQAFPSSPSLYDLGTNVSFVLQNTHTSLYPPLPTVPNMAEIGGYFIDPPQKLPQDLQEFLDNAKDGVVYFSMGSNLKSKDMPQEKKQILLNVLGKLKEKVLWKFEEDLPGKPSNVMIRKWLPQQDILAHPNIKLFITHGGLLSTTETIYHGVPILAIPVFGDQTTNAARAVSNGFGLTLPYADPDFTEERLGNLLKELLTNPQYKENAQRRSKVFHDRPMSPMQTAVYWIEYVIRHKGAPHLRVAGIKLPWYKYFMLDVLGAIVLALAAVFVVLRIVCKKLLCRKKKEAKKQKTN